MNPAQLETAADAMIRAAVELVQHMHALEDAGERHEMRPVGFAARITRVHELVDSIEDALRYGMPTAGDVAWGARALEQLRHLIAVLLRSVEHKGQVWRLVLLTRTLSQAVARARLAAAGIELEDDTGGDHTPATLTHALACAAQAPPRSGAPTLLTIAGRQQPG